MAHKIDHIAVGAQSLAQGVAAMQNQLGVTVPDGSKHTAMSTHNCVMQTGHESFFELIAIDPEAPDPGRVRWFTLDDPATQQRLAERPRALCWVVGTDDLDALVARSPIDLGEIVFFQRGERTWRLTVPRDGSLPEGGLVPAFIEWSPGPHPSTGQQDLGVHLDQVLISHRDPARLQALFDTLEIGELAEIHQGDPALRFAFSTPSGRVVID